MILLLSPSKTINNIELDKVNIATYIPEFITKSEQLIKILRKKPTDDLVNLMSISNKLAILNKNRYENFTTPFTKKNSHPAILSFQGDVYEGIEVKKYQKKDFEFAQKHLRIISGLYGLLKPLDLIQPYRLEMGTKLKNESGKDLYEFWNDSITEAINFELKSHKEKTIINLASQEYFKAIKPQLLAGKLVNIVFKERQGKELKIIGLFAKRARGKMANFIIRNHLEKPEELLRFNDDGYKFSDRLSDEHNYVFTRNKPVQSKK
ncbi:MAG: peroxide stress protein YaaA [Rickettsiales bacterium]